MRRKPDNREPKLGVHDFLAGIILLCRAIRGRVGDRVYKTYGDKIIVTRVPRFDGYKPSAAQRDRRGRMRASTSVPAWEKRRVTIMKSSWERTATIPAPQR